MTMAIRLRPEAEQDLTDAALWYEEQKPNLGHEFLDEVVTVLSSIADAPQMYPIIHRNIQRALIHRFPFGVYYHVATTAIVVIAVMHGSRSPRRWKSRV